MADAKPALLVIDMQMDFCTPGAPLFVAGAPAIREAVVAAVEAARARSVPVIWVVREHHVSGVDAEVTRAHLYKDGKGPVALLTPGRKKNDDGESKEVSARAGVHTSSRPATTPTCVQLVSRKGGGRGVGAPDGGLTREEREATDSQPRAQPAHDHLHPHRHARPTTGSELVDGLHPAPGEHVISKKRFSAFWGTAAASLLRRLGVGHVVLAGVQTPNCIRATAFDAVAEDFPAVSVLADATASASEEVQVRERREEAAGVGVSRRSGCPGVHSGISTSVSQPALSLSRARARSSLSSGCQPGRPARGQRQHAHAGGMEGVPGRGRARVPAVRAVREKGGRAFIFSFEKRGDGESVRRGAQAGLLSGTRPGGGATARVRARAQPPSLVLTRLSPSLLPPRTGHSVFWCLKTDRNERKPFWFLLFSSHSPPTLPEIKRRPNTHTHAESRHTPGHSQANLERKRGVGKAKGRREERRVVTVARARGNQPRPSRSQLPPARRAQPSRQKDTPPATPQTHTTTPWADK